MNKSLEIGEEAEAAPGVYISRRALVSGLSTVLLAAALDQEAHAQAARLSEATLSLEEFLLEAKPIAATLVRDTSRVGQNRYLLSLASLAARLLDVPVPEMRDSGQGETRGTYIGFNPGGEPFNILHWRLDPGARIRPHAHTYGNVVTLGLDGEAEVSNYETIETPDFASRSQFRVRRTRQQRLRQGSINLVNLEEDYIHGFAAGPDGARGLDITTRIRERSPTPYLIIRAGTPDSELLTGEWSLDDPREVDERAASSPAVG